MSNRQERWEIAQEREREYVGSSKDLDWGIPHSLVFWKEFLHLDDIEGRGIEVGCGLNGIYRFVENIIGIDPIDFSEYSDNFIQGIGEELPFSSGSVDFAICCNAIDHTQNPQKVMDEMFRVSSKVILWTYIYPRAVSWIMERVDKTHPHHFTEGDFQALLRGRRYRVIKETGYVLFDTHMKHAVSLSAKLKLLVAHVLGVRGLCIHLEVLGDARERSKIFVEDLMPDPICRDIVLREEGIYDMMDSVILDIGCGTGFFTSKFEDAIGLDLSTDNIRSAKKMLPERDFIIADGCNIPVRSECVHGVVLMHVLEHLHNPIVAIQEIHRCLVVQGEIVIVYEFYCTSRLFVRPIRAVFGWVIRWEEYGHRKTILSDSRDWMMSDRQKVVHLLERYFVITKVRRLRGLVMDILVSVSIVADRITRPRRLMAKPMGSQYPRLNSALVKFYIRYIRPSVVAIAEKDPFSSSGSNILALVTKSPSEDDKGDAKGGT